MNGRPSWIGSLLGAPDLSMTDQIQVWIAGFSAITAFSTFGLVLFAAYQIRAIRWSEKKWATIRACNTYDTDPVLNQATAQIFSLSKGTDYSYKTIEPAIHSVLTLLNYFSSMAIGIDQGVYVKSIVKDNLKENIERAVDVFITPEYSKYINRSDLESLVRLRESWQERPTKVR